MAEEKSKFTWQAPPDWVWRAVVFVLALGAGLLLPFVLQHPAYVATQYTHWLELLRADDRSRWPQGSGYLDFMLLLRLAHGVGFDGDITLGIDEIGAEGLEDRPGGVDVVFRHAKPNAEGIACLVASFGGIEHGVEAAVIGLLERLREEGSGYLDHFLPRVSVRQHTVHGLDPGGKLRAIAHDRRIALGASRNHANLHA